MAHGNGITGSGFSTDPTDAVAPKILDESARGVHGGCHDGMRGRLTVAGAERLPFSCLHAIIQP